MICRTSVVDRLGSLDRLETQKMVSHIRLKRKNEPSSRIASMNEHLSVINFIELLE